MSLKLNDLIPMLMCSDVQKSIAFYCDVLGFEVSGRLDEVGRSGWASLRNGETQPMLASPTYVPQAPKIGGRHTQAQYYFYPEDVEVLHAAVRERGWKAGDHTVRSYGMKEFELIDPDGHVLVFGQETDEPPTPE